jgi:TonB family protein
MDFGDDFSRFLEPNSVPRIESIVVIANANHPPPEGTADNPLPQPMREIAIEAFEMDFRKPGTLSTWVACFVRLEGSYRFVGSGDRPFWRQPPVPIGVAPQRAKVVKIVRPKYPKDAREAGVSGTVKLHAIIGKDGKAKPIVFVSGPQMLAQAAVEAVEKWRYEPAIFNGAVVEVEAFIDVVFDLSHK